MNKDKLYLLHIAECIQLIREYTQEGKEFFLRDLKTQDAVLRKLHTLSESAQRLSQKLKLKHHLIDWRSICAFRNVVVHDYLGIDLYRIWDLVVQDLQPLKAVIDSILQEIGALSPLD